MTGNLPRRQSIWHYVRNYRFHSVLLRYYVIVFLVLYIPLMFTIIGITRYYSRAVRSQIHAAYSGTFEIVRETFDAQFAAIDLLLFRLSTNETIRDYLVIEDLTRPTYDAAEAVNALVSELFPPAESVFEMVYVTSGQSGFAVDSSGRRTPIDADELPLPVKRLSFDAGETIVWDVLPDGVYVSTPARVAGGQSLEGTITVKLHLLRFLQLAQDLNSSYAEDFYVLAPAMDTIVSGRRGDVEIEEDAGWLVSAVEAASNGSPYLVDREDKTYVLLKQTGYQGRIYVSMIDANQYYGVVRRVNRLVTLLGALLLIVVIPLAFVLAVIFYNPVRNLMNIVEGAEIEAGAADSIASGDYDEHRYIADNMTRSIEQNRTMEAELKRRLAMLNRAQASALQSQINPHFLYNTLSTVNWLAMDLTGGENEVSRVVNALSNMLRITMDTDQSLVPIADELTHARMYMDVQRARYRDAFGVSWDVPERLHDFKIVKICLQPILENAIHHGIDPNNGGGQIRVTGHELSTRIELAVTDDGVGMSVAALEIANARLASEYAIAHEHIGLANVNQRLKLVFGEQSGLRLSRAARGGLTVTITIPKLI